MTRTEAVCFLRDHPVKFAHLVGFDKLGDLHDEWIKKMVLGKEDETIQGARNTYKTSSVSVALVLIMILLPNARILFLRKTDNDVKEVLRTVSKILSDPRTAYFVQCIYGVSLKLTKQSANEVSTNLTTDIRGASQLTGLGIGASLTGKHFDYIFTDDIVNREDRVSKAEREKTKLVYQELQNLKNRGGKIFNTGTPWHPDDAFELMPEAQKYDCYHPEVKKIIDAETLEELKESMSPALFAANYELRHIASEDVIFENPQTGAEMFHVEQGLMHIDAAYYGEDYTAWGVMNKHDGKYYIYGKMRRKHVEECFAEIAEDYERFMCRKAYVEDNADKGFVAKELRKNYGLRVVSYTESENKYIKIVTHLKKIWKDLIFVEGTDEEYIEQVCDYFEDADHDDAPDDAACLARLFAGKKEINAAPVSIWS